jgi:hypothetical protein
MRRALVLLLLAVSAGCGEKPKPTAEAPPPATAQEVAELRQQFALLQQTVQQNTAAQNAMAVAVTELKTAIAGLSTPAAAAPSPAIESPAVAPSKTAKTPGGLFTAKERATRDAILAALRGKQKLTMQQFTFARAGIGRELFASDMARFPAAFIVEHYDWLVEEGFTPHDVLELQSAGHEPQWLTRVVHGIRGTPPFMVYETDFETIRSDPILAEFYRKNARPR